MVVPDPPPEPGIDLSTVPVCKDCGLEIANEDWHKMWHDAQFAQMQDMQRDLKLLRKLLEHALQGTAAEMPVITVDPTQIEGSSYDIGIWDEVKPNTAWDPTLMKRNFTDSSFKRREAANYHHKKVQKEKMAKLERLERKPDDDYHYDKT